MKTQLTTPLPRTLRVALSAAVLPAWLLMLTLQVAHADSATWDLNPISGDWNTADNWTPATVPNGPSDTGTFDGSNTTGVSISADTEVDGIAFNPGASPFTLTVSPNGSTALTISGVGITNNSAITQNFVADQDGGPHRTDHIHEQRDSG